MSVQLAADWLVVVGSPAIDAAGNLAAVVAMVIDIVAREQQAVKDHFSVASLLQRDDVSAHAKSSL